MNESIFDSSSEKKLFNQLKTRWKNYVDVFPQIPVRNVIGYDRIQSQNLSEKAINFLLKSSFDFVVCELKTGIPILVIEFDGLSGGYSREAKFFIRSLPKNDEYRKLKMETKLDLCSQFQIPMIAVSYEETDLLKESDDYITVLDVIIGSALEKRDFRKNYLKYNQMLSDAYEFGGKKSTKLADLEINFLNEQANPVKEKIKKITEKFPFWSGQVVFPDKNSEYLNGQFRLASGKKTESNVRYEKVLISVDISIRHVGISQGDCLSIFNTIGEYCLARKAQRLLGSDIDKWKELDEKTTWTKF